MFAAEGAGGVGRGEQGVPDQRGVFGDGVGVDGLFRVRGRGVVQGEQGTATWSAQHQAVGVSVVAWWSAITDGAHHRPVLHGRSGLGGSEAGGGLPASAAAADDLVFGDVHLDRRDVEDLPAGAVHLGGAGEVGSAATATGGFVAEGVRARLSDAVRSVAGACWCGMVCVAAAAAVAWSPGCGGSGRRRPINRARSSPAAQVMASIREARDSPMARASAGAAPAAWWVVVTAVNTVDAAATASAPPT